MDDWIAHHAYLYATEVGGATNDVATLYATHYTALVDSDYCPDHANVFWEFVRTLTYDWRSE